MESWTTTSKLVLGITCCAVFAAVSLLAGRDSPTKRLSADAPRERATSIAGPSSRPGLADRPFATRERKPSSFAVPRTPSTSDPPEASDERDIAELSRQVMPVDETTAEENEQRGDAIRRLSSSLAMDSTQPLIYALRNDVDIRNRILAINGLRRAALAGNPDPGIEDALVEASRCSDDVIASQARQAVSDIEGVRSR
jgi:hypothetical protein